MKPKFERENSSFRDPSGFIFFYEGEIFRQINKGYKEHYDFLVKSGLYNKLTQLNLLVPHEEVDFKKDILSETVYKIIKPVRIPFISYPYEWSLSQYKDAALTTLKVQKVALDYGMTLKDASAFNIQFLRGKPVLIDTLSFKRYKDGNPWVAYRQYCQHFFAPLAIAKYSNIELFHIIKSHLDGIPLGLASKILPGNSYLNPLIMIHIHLHAKSQKRYSDKEFDLKTKKLNKYAIHGLIDGLNKFVERIKFDAIETQWSNYYEKDHNYSVAAFEKKKKVVIEYLDKVSPTSLWDIGANTGEFSRLASDKGIFTVSMDLDLSCVELNYKLCKQNNAENILPLLVDIANPSPAIGWNNKERKALLERGPVDCAMALALIHHLIISNNIPLDLIVILFKKICNYLIVEFVPKNDSQVCKLLLNRVDIYHDYTRAKFENAFLKHFNIQESKMITKSGRILYLMKRK